MSLLAGCTSSSSNGATSGSSPDAGTTADGGSGTTNGTTPESTAIASRCLEGGAGDTKDGWVRTIGPDSVNAVNEHVGVAIGYSFEIDDPLRAASHFAEGVWDRLLSDEYTVVGERTTGGDHPGELSFASGTVMEKATGTTFFATVVARPVNGTAFPTVALAPDEATLTAKLPTPADIEAMRAYNAFPLSCSAVQGKWTSESSTAAATYNAAGSFTGIHVTSLQLGLTLDPAKHYDWHAKVTDNSGAVSENESGSYSSGDLNLDLVSDAGKTTNYDAAFVAVKGGIVLSLTDRKFTGDHWVLYRAR